MGFNSGFKGLISRNLPWWTEKNQRNSSRDSCYPCGGQNCVRVGRMTTWTSILGSTTVKMEYLCSRTVWFMSAALVLCVWYQMGISRSSEESRLDVRITEGSFPSQGPEFCAMQFVQTCLGPIQPSFWWVLGRSFPRFQKPMRTPDFTHWPSVEIKNASMQWRG